MLGRIFINYRRDDSIGTAGRLYDRLIREFGSESIFMDVDSIPIGVDFAEYLDEQVRACDAFLAIIGNGWSGAVDSFGNRRLNNSRDFVAIEIGSALTRRIRVIPVLVDGARMPTEEELPEALKPLARRNAVELRNARFGRDTDALIRRLREILETMNLPRKEILVTEDLPHHFASAPFEVPIKPSLESRSAERVQTDAQSVASTEPPASVVFERGKEVTEPNVDQKEDKPLSTPLTGSGDSLEATPNKPKEQSASRRSLLRLVRDAARNISPVGAIVSLTMLLGIAAVASQAPRWAQDARRQLDAKADEERKQVEDRETLAARAAAAERQAMPGTVFRDCSTCPEMVIVPAGSFGMGASPSDAYAKSEQPYRLVTLSYRFAISRVPVTFDEWDTCTKVGLCPIAQDGNFGRGRQPVINVSWADVRLYLLWLSRYAQKNVYRLPSEAEWEYAARAGSEQRYPWGLDVGHNMANCIGCGSRWDGKQPAPVGSFFPNAFGLYDMQGNVWQWVEDCWHENYIGAPSNGAARLDGECDTRVVRGGSWESYPEALRSSNRGARFSDYRANMLGFRIVRAIAQ